MPPADKKRSYFTKLQIQVLFRVYGRVSLHIPEKSYTALAAYRMQVAWETIAAEHKLHLNVIATPYIEHLTLLSVNITGEKVVALIK